jgi:hypothetical protein
MTDERAQGPQLQFGSTHPSLFTTGCADPRNYVGPALIRRAVSSHGYRADQDDRSRPGTSLNLRPPGQEVRQGMLDDGVGAHSIETIDVNRSFNPKYPHLTSPRSIQACKSLGLTPEDLLVVTHDDCVSIMRRNGEDTSDIEVVRKRHEYLTRRRAQKFAAVSRERERLICSVSRTTFNGKAQVSSSVLAQKQQLQKIVDANANRLKQQLLHQEVLQRQREKEEECRRQQQRHDEEQREQQRLLELEKARKEEEAQRLRAEVKDLQRHDAAAAVEAKRAESERKDVTLRDRLNRKRLVMEAKNEAKRQHNTERRQAMREQAEALAAHRRDVFEQRWEQFQASRDEFANKREQEARERAVSADRKREKIQRTKQRCDDVLKAKIMRTEQREERAEAMLREHEEARRQELEEKAEYDALKAAQREKVYQDALAQHNSKVQRLTETIENTETHMREMQDHLCHLRRLKQEEARESEMDKRDCVLRRQRADEHRRRELERRIQEKSERVSSMKAQQRDLARKFRDMREEAERSRVPIVNPTPGPTDYDASPRVKDGPKWKFGLPAAVLGMRQIARDCPAPAYESSPGPCMYAPQLRVKGPQASICRTDRWHQPSEMHSTPGPADYAPEVFERMIPTTRSPSKH